MNGKRMSMENPNVLIALDDMIQKIEALTSENENLKETNNDCARTIISLMAKIESLQKQIQETKSLPKPVPYKKRPPIMRGRTVQSNVGCGPLYITLNEDESGHPFEVFFKLGKSGSCQQSYLEALGVAMSVGLRYGADPQKFVDKFEGMRCPNPKMRNAEGPSTLSCADGISQGLAKALTLSLSIADVNPRGEADVVSVAEPRFSQAHDQANDVIDLIGLPVSTATQTATPEPPVVPSIRKAMATGVGMCPKCAGNLISQGGCIQCIQQCGYVGKCS